MAREFYSATIPDPQKAWNQNAILHHLKAGYDIVANRHVVNIQELVK